MSESRISRRHFLATTAAGLALTVVGSKQLAAQTKQKSLPAGVPKEMTVYKDPNCGCCKEWVKHVQAAGFVTTVRDTADMNSVKSSMGVPDALHSCHTAKVGAYVIEGHVPADQIVRLLIEKKADARGLAVPGMPMGSPGMEGPRKDKYDVLLFDKAGKSRVYASR
jgi:hypothetical protein